MEKVSYLWLFLLFCGVLAHENYIAEPYANNYDAKPSYHEDYRHGQKSQPYRFGYEIKDGKSNSHFHKEESDEYNYKKGSYGYTDAYGLYRHVDYIADQKGFRAKIRTNEPGVDNQDPADVHIYAEIPPHPLKTYSKPHHPIHQTYPEKTLYGNILQEPIKYDYPDQGYDHSIEDSLKYDHSEQRHIKYETPSKKILRNDPYLTQQKYDVPATQQIKYDVPATQQKKYDIPATQQIKYDVPATQQIEYDHSALQQLKYDYAAAQQQKHEHPVTEQLQYDHPVIQQLRYDHPVAQQLKYDHTATPHLKYDFPATQQQKYGHFSKYGRKDQSGKGTPVKSSERSVWVPIYSPPKSKYYH